jgi:hypothetical protein
MKSLYFPKYLLQVSKMLIFNQLPHLPPPNPHIQFFKRGEGFKSWEPKTKRESSRLFIVLLVPGESQGDSHPVNLQG